MLFILNTERRLIDEMLGMKYNSSTLYFSGYVRARDEFSSFFVFGLFKNVDSYNYECLFAAALFQLFIIEVNKHNFIAELNYIFTIVSNLVNKQHFKGTHFFDFVDTQLGTVPFQSYYNALYSFFEDPLYNTENELLTKEYKDFFCSTMRDRLFSFSDENIMLLLDTKSYSIADIFKYVFKKDVRLNFNLFRYKLRSIFSFYNYIILNIGIHTGLLFRGFLENYQLKLLYKLPLLKIGQISFKNWYKSLSIFVVLSALRYNLLSSSSIFSLIVHSYFFNIFLSVTFKNSSDNLFFARRGIISLLFEYSLLIPSLIMCLVKLYYFTHEYAIDWFCMPLFFFKSRAFSQFGNMFIGIITDKNKYNYLTRVKITHTYTYIVRSVFISFSVLKDFLIIKLFRPVESMHFILENSIFKVLIRKLWLSFSLLKLQAKDVAVLKETDTRLKCFLMLDIQSNQSENRWAMSNIKSELDLLSKAAYAHVMGALFLHSADNLLNFYNRLSMDVSFCDRVLTITRVINPKSVRSFFY